MYNIPDFKTKDNQKVLDFMHQHPFAILAGCDNNNYPVATHVPLLIKEREGKLYLQGHIMKQTDHHKAFVQNENVLAVFTGPNTYISASWYSNPKQASTWNYMTVHAKGLLQFKDEAFLMNLLDETTAHFEHNPASPALFEHIPGDYINKLKNAIIAFEIEVASIDHVFKLSQNQDEESYENIVGQLSKGNTNAKEMAEIMKMERDNK